MPEMSRKAQQKDGVRQVMKRAAADGGSKSFALIDRFSEDIDIAVSDLVAPASLEELGAQWQENVGHARRSSLTPRSGTSATAARIRGYRDRIPTLRPST